MSDIQDLIHKTTMDSIERGKAIERERIIKLLHDNIGWCEALEYDYFADDLEGLIKGEAE